MKLIKGIVQREELITHEVLVKAHCAHNILIGYALKRNWHESEVDNSTKARDTYLSWFL